MRSRLLLILLTLVAQNLSHAINKKGKYWEYSSKELSRLHLRAVETHALMDNWELELLRGDTHKDNLFNNILELGDIQGTIYRTFYFVRSSNKAIPTIRNTVIDVELDFHDGLGKRLPVVMKQSSVGTLLYFGQDFALKYLGSPSVRNVMLSNYQMAPDPKSDILAIK